MKLQELFSSTRSIYAKRSSKKSSAPYSSSFAGSGSSKFLPSAGTSDLSTSQKNGASSSSVSEVAICESSISRRAQRKRDFLHSATPSPRVKSRLVSGKFQPVSARLLRELEGVFKLFDANGDGKISASELGFVLRSLGDNPSDEELHLMVREVDANGDGYVDFEEFLSLNASFTGMAEGLASTEELMEVFSIFDADRNGYITAEELHSVLLSLGENGSSLEDCCRMIQGIDSDGDGLVNFEEFSRMMACT